MHARLRIHEVVAVVDLEVVEVGFLQLLGLVALPRVGVDNRPVSNVVFYGVQQGLRRSEKVYLGLGLRLELGLELGLGLVLWLG